MKTKITILIAVVIVTCLSFTFVSVHGDPVADISSEKSELTHKATPVGGLLADEVTR